MKKNIIAIICGVVAAAVIITGTLVSMGKMREKDSIGSSAALMIALNDAGVGKEEAKNTKSNFEREDGKYIFDVEFDANGYEYEYNIDAKSGEILKRDVDKRGAQTTATTANRTSAGEKTTSEKAESENNQKDENQTTKATTQKAANTDYISLDEAKGIALKNAGLSASEVRFTKAKLDYDDGVAEYEIEFIKGNTEYEYEINAKSGKITGFDKETKSTKSQSKTKSDDDVDDDDDFDDDDDLDEEDDD
ncbi:MAG: PepSY domain-containing protein [Eubacterium sp.]|nr:PepSY domain-containing protein [Eubacterium sp.]